MKLTAFSYAREDLAMMPPRFAESNKGDYGRLLCVCGSVGMCGAAYLSALAAYRTGAGLVRILTPKENLIPLQTSLPEAIVSVYDGESSDLTAISEAVEWADAIVIGCGLGRSYASGKVLGTVLREATAPVVIDADALNIISESAALKKYMSGNIITPHLLEMSRLCGLSVTDINSDRESTAYGFAKATGAVCVLKSHRTCVSDGSERIYVNTSGNNGMSTAGSGDVLAGIIGGILAQNKRGSITLTDAASLGVYLHGIAGDIAAESLGEYSLMARDIIASIPKALNLRP
ncbi:MAG: NAD(P)H-hydrate dehydratase [Clostridia bacterium]|nr:NAD(P)H-hydrate dehydratase [Clostridia bacterium]